MRWPRRRRLATGGVIDRRNAPVIGEDAAPCVRVIPADDAPDEIDLDDRPPVPDPCPDCQPGTPCVFCRALGLATRPQEDTP